MQAFDLSVAKTQVGRAMLQGHSWREAMQTAGLHMKPGDSVACLITTASSTWTASILRCGMALKPMPP